MAEERGHSARDMQSLFIRDPLLGWVPNPGFRSPHLSYDAKGTRAQPALAADGGPPLLTTGNSYGEGEDVADDETWPVILQALLGRRTVNAGVGGYGLDQVVLRTEQLAASLRPAAIVASFIADDVRRNEMHYLWGAEKAYFTLERDGSLVLRNVPVPESAIADDRLSFWQRAFGWSALVELTVRRVSEGDEWITGNRRATPADTGEQLACPLMRRLASLGVPTLVVAQYESTAWLHNAARRNEQRRLSRLVLDCAASAALATLDTFNAIAQVARAGGLLDLYVNNHHSAEGNRLVAETIAAELKRRGMLP